MRTVTLSFLITVLSCADADAPANQFTASSPLRSYQHNPDTWQGFLQRLPLKAGPVLDYRGQQIVNQRKHMAIVDYDIGTADLQQCADALIRLRAEYLFAQKAYDKIGFHFTSGQYYSWADYCSGHRPRMQSRVLQFITMPPCPQTYQCLRRYLNIVYAYAGTASLFKELKPAAAFEIGTVIIEPGFPGHCSIIVDERIGEQGEKEFRLAEGFMPAQSIYVLRNPSASDGWFALKKEATIRTASYTFRHYALRKFT